MFVKMEANMCNMVDKVVAIIIIAHIVGLGAETFEEQVRLHEYLEKVVHKDVRPIFNQSRAIDVTIQFNVMSVQSLDEKTQVLSSTVGIVMTWVCETLAWNASQYGNATIVRLTASETWLPDIAMYNSIDNNQLLNMEDQGAFRVSVKSNGHSVWSSGGNFDTNCKVDITNYPFDTQVCEYILGKYFSSDKVLNLVPVHDGIVMPNFITNDVWHLEEIGMKKRMMSENYTKIVIRLQLQRRPLFYILNVILPVGILSFMNILSFKIPVTSGERVSYCVSLFLTFMVLLDTISDSMPKVSQTVSYLQIYVNLQLVVGMVITLISVVLVKMSVNWNDEHVPSWVQAMYRITKRYKRIDTVTRVDYNGLHDAELLDNVRQAEEPKETSTTTSHKPTDPKVTIKNLDQAFFYIFLSLFLLVNITFTACMLTYRSEQDK